MNATFIFNDLDCQRAELARLADSQSIDFVGLYGNASALAGSSLSADDEELWALLAHNNPVHVCPSAAARRQVDINAAAKAKLVYLSLPAMLTRVQSDPTPQSLHVILQTNTELARVEALELCLAALAVDWQVSLSLRGAGITGLLRDGHQPGAKGFGSLPMFELGYARISPNEINGLASDSLTLPWRAEIAPAANLFAVSPDRPDLFAVSPDRRDLTLVF